MAQTKKIDYAALSAELQTILAQLQSEETDIDHALKQYERGLHIITQLEQYLQAAENKVTKLKATFDAQP